MNMKTENRQRRVLLVDDDPSLTRLIAFHLQDLGCVTESVANGEIGLERCLSGDYDLVVLDIMLPGLNGLQVLKEVRLEKPKLPILMLTAQGEEDDKVKGLELGADDYMAKPFGIKELVARVRALLRRTSASPTAEETVAREDIVMGDLVIRVDAREVELNGEQLGLTNREFELLLFLASNPGKAFTRAQLLDAIWGYQYLGFEHTVNSHINRLRSKLEGKASALKYIETVWGHGYRFAKSVKA